MCICKSSIVSRTSGNLAAILDFDHTSTSHETGSTTTIVADSNGLYLHSHFRGGLRKTRLFWNRVRNGRSRSSKVVNFGTNRKRVYATFYWSSIVTLVLSCPVSEILQVFCFRRATQKPIPSEFFGCSPWTRLPLLCLQGAKTLSRANRRTDGCYSAFSFAIRIDSVSPKIGLFHAP